MLQTSSWALSFDDWQMKTLEDHDAFHFRMQLEIDLHGIYCSVYYISKH